MTIDSSGSIYAAGKTVSTNIPGNSNSGEGDFLVVKLDASGSPYPSFGQNGIFVYGRSGDEMIDSIAVSESGKIYVCGSSASTDISGTVNKGDLDILILRLNPDGTFDETFDEDGKIMIGGRNTDIVNELNITENGRVYVFGSSASPDIPGTTLFGYDDFMITVFHD
nr:MULTISPECIES: hypothetical protein [unclassified Oceanispirochaeta]